MLGREALPRPLRRVLAGSAIVHALLVTALALQGAIAAYLRPKPKSSVITTKLVKLGVKRDEQLLPRVPVAPPPPAPKSVDIAAPPSSAPPPVKTEPSDAKERLENMTRVSNALSRLKGMTDDSGDPEGSPDGDAAVAIMGSKYMTEVHNCMKKNYFIEGVPLSRLAGKSVTVLVRVQKDGRLYDSDVTESSGEPIFDSAVQRSVKRCGKVSAPPDELRDLVRDEGVGIVFHP